MTSAQERTLAQYHGLMQVNASSHLLRAARETGLVDQLRDGQRTAQQLAENLKLDSSSLNLLLDALVAMGIVEKYDQDHALSRAGHLLCQYDQDLGDAVWTQLADRVRGGTDRSEHDDRFQQNYLAATQWTHTASAMQAAEILDIGGADQKSGLRILDLGGGSAVWSCAMAHRAPQSSVTVVEVAQSLVAARSTAESIGLGDRLNVIEGHPLETEVPENAFDLALIAQRVSGVDIDQAKSLIRKAAASLTDGGKVVVVDLFRGPTSPSLAESIEAIRLDLMTTGGRMPALEEVQQWLLEAGLADIQFTFLAASQANMGLAMGVK